MTYFPGFLEKVFALGTGVTVEYKKNNRQHSLCNMIINWKGILKMKNNL